jgi:type I restriction enzyme, S subunit
MYSKNLDMRSNYRPIGEFIQLKDERNTGLKVQQLLGLSISKQFIPSVANIVGTDMENYKIIRKNQFACSTMQVRRDKKMPVALLQEVDEAIISQAYPIFEVKDKNQLLPEYLMMWFTRSEFDREACFNAVGGVRGSLEWEDFCNMQLPIPSITKQREIVKEYNVIKNRITLNQQLIQKLEETAQAIYKQWFVDFEFPDEDGLPYKSSGGEMVESELGEIPRDWKVEMLSYFGGIKHGYAFKGEDFTVDETSLVLVSPGNFKIHGGFNFAKNKYYTGKYPKGYVLSEDDFIVNMTDLSKNGDTLGNTALIPRIIFKTLLHNQRVGKFEFKETIYAYYLFFSTNQKVYKNYILGTATGTTVRHTSPDRIGRFKVVLPDKKLIEKFNLIVSPLTKLINQSPSEQYKMEELKELLLSKLATIEN